MNYAALHQGIVKRSSLAGPGLAVFQLHLCKEPWAQVGDMAAEAQQAAVLCCQGGKQQLPSQL